MPPTYPCYTMLVKKHPLTPPPHADHEVIPISITFSYLRLDDSWGHS